MNEIVLINGTSVSDGFARRLVEVERTLKELEAEKKGLHAAMLEAMEKAGVYAVKSELVDATYIAATTRETFDTKRFREECPDEYDKYAKLSPVKASVRVKIKEGV